MYLFIFIYLFIFNAHTVNPNAMPHSAASHLGPHCSAELVHEFFKSHYLRASDSLNYGLEIEKIDFLEILPIFNFCREMNKNAYFFSIFHFCFHGNHDFLFLAFSAIF